MGTDEIRKPRDYSIRRLREVCQATAPNPAKESKIGRFTRIFSIYLTYIFLRLPFTPNQISIIGVAVFFAGAFAYFSPDRNTQLLGPALYFLSILLDGVDGEVARFRNAQSKVGGAYVEPVSHDLMYGGYFLLLGIALYPQFGVLVVAAGAIAGITKVLARSLALRFWTLVYVGTEREDATVQNADLDKRPWYRRQFDFWNKNIYSYPAIVGPLLIATYVGRMDLFLYFYAASFTVLLALLFAKQVWYFNTHTLPS
jgi:phosphatidylglycerophosphate synthase